MAKVTGLRGKNSPMNRATPAQAANVKNQVEIWRYSARWSIEVQTPPYIGPGCAAEKGDISVVVDGRIEAMVMPSGQVY